MRCLALVLTNLRRCAVVMLSGRMSSCRFLMLGLAGAACLLLGSPLRACDGMSPSGSPRARPHLFVGTVAVQRKFPPGDDRLAEPACRPSPALPGRDPHAAVDRQRPAGPGLGRRPDRAGARARGASRHSFDAKPSPRICFSPRSSSAPCLGLIDPARATTEDSRVAGMGLTILGWRRWLVARAQFERRAWDCRDHFAVGDRCSGSERVPAVDASAARGG